MGAYRYCDSCGSGLYAPTAREVHDEGKACPSCGEWVPCYDTYADIIERLECRIEALERGEE